MVLCVFFEVSHYVIEKPLYEQGFILLPHLAALALGVGPGGQVTDIYSFFVIGVLHLVSAGVLGYQWQDRFRITGILGAHLGSLALGAVLLLARAVHLDWSLEL